MTLSMQDQWKMAAAITKRLPAEMRAAACLQVTTASQSVTQPCPEKIGVRASAQVGTSVVATRLPISGERCSIGSHRESEADEDNKANEKIGSHEERPRSGDRPRAAQAAQNRPRKQEERIPPIHVRYKTREQVEHVKGKAAEARLSVNGYICSATLDHLYIPPYDPGMRDELRQIKRQLVGIGINLNQLMHRVNAGIGHTDPVLDYIDVIREPVLDGIRLIRKALSRHTDGPMP